MKTQFYKLECLTNLHVGSGELNYNIVDNEVEKDPITGYPTIHASGVKGALRDALACLGETKVSEIFGAPGDKDEGSSGKYKFLDAALLARPMRVANSNSIASIPVVTIASVNNYLARLTSFGCNHYGITQIDTPDFGNNIFLTNCPEEISIEGEKTGKFDKEEPINMLSDMLGTTFAIVKSFDKFDLPVVARNCLHINKNLWYEEVVPTGSVFYIGIITDDNDPILALPNIVQFGGNASIGCGFTKVTMIKE